MCEQVLNVIENETTDAEASPTTHPKSSNTIKMSNFWLLCFLGYFVYLYFGLGIDSLDTGTETCKSDLKIWSCRSCFWGNPWQIMRIGISIGPISTLGLPMLAVSLICVSFNILLFTLHGFGNLVRIQLQRTDSPLSIFLVVGFHVFLAAGFVGIFLASRHHMPCRPTTEIRERPEHTFYSIHGVIIAARPNLPGETPSTGELLPTAG
jgi:hypothetical protein